MMRLGRPGKPRIGNLSDSCHNAKDSLELLVETVLTVTCYLKARKPRRRHVMANIYRPKYKYVDMKTGKKKMRTARKWYGRYRDDNDRVRRVALAGDKRVAQSLLDQLLTQTERRKAGVIDPVMEAAERPIKEHLDDYQKHLKQKENSPRYVHDTCVKLKKMVKSRQWWRAAHIRATDVESYLAGLADRGCGVRTRNTYLSAAKSFSRWLYRNRRLRDDPLRHLGPSNESVDRRHIRRPLSQEEFAKLIEAAEQGPPVQSIPGVDRAMMYVLSAYTGFRKGEIGSLTVRSFDLEGNPATVTVEAAYSKRRRQDKQVLHPVVVERLRCWLRDRDPADGDILFPIDKRTCGTDRRTAKMMAEDLAAA